MAQVIYARHASADLERRADFLRDKTPRGGIDAIEVIRDGIEILQRHPLIGGFCEHELRELIISYGKTGYVTLYSSYEALEDVALILALRHQHEAGYGDFPYAVSGQTQKVT